MANKIYTTLRQQLKILRSKNMNISINGQGAKVKKILDTNLYFTTKTKLASSFFVISLLFLRKRFVCDTLTAACLSIKP